ncbi:TIGR03618 family F420-dependent PPOX class oxidoreductase [Actinoallomurus bryophytorum]|uniref:PPOX class probable F420-dependent enzyme n=1 Tax=Actinoallomurus bryophytorum TaxID=1490222 RepID=A0A543CFG1_9ACTN|nr:PPOX class F420-dependent oxidoreductase [Actinoallomurus bryophytorum]TQL95838.1 PPOX class probable F420-dependent enzyme [Actinoallomurus bryophytorum]
MDPSRARDFAREHHRAVLVTRHADGRPQTSPVICAVDDKGRIIVSTRETAAKTRNLLRDPRVTLCLFTDAFFGEWAQVDGEAEIVRLPDAMEPLVDYYRMISGEHPDWDEYRESMENDRRVLVRVTITHAGPDVHG